MAKCHLHYYTNNKNLHLITPLKLHINWLNFFYIKQEITDKIMKRNFNNKKSLLFKDYDYIKNVNDINFIK